MISQEQFIELMKAKEILDAQLKAAVLAQPQLVLETKAPFESAPLPKSPK